jgi:uncharacterized iron-regulated membrane protein
LTINRDCTVPLTQILFGIALVVVLLGVAGFYGWRQVRLLRDLPPEGLGEEELHLRRRAWRRLISCVLMVVLAVLLAGALLYLEEPAQRLADQVDALGPQAAEMPEHRAFVNFYSYYWIAFLLVLLVLVVLAGFDLWAVRRFGLRQLRRLQEDRRAMIARQSALLRERRDQEN